jgi:hypothetical protein
MGCCIAGWNGKGTYYGPLIAPTQLQSDIPKGDGAMFHSHGSHMCTTTSGHGLVVKRVDFVRSKRSKGGWRVLAKYDLGNEVCAKKRATIRILCVLTICSGITSDLLMLII